MIKQSLPKLLLMLLFISVIFYWATTYSQLPLPSEPPTGFMASTFQSVDCGNCNGRKFVSQCLWLSGEKILKIFGTHCNDSIKVNMDTIPGYNPDLENPPTGLDCQETKLVVSPALACPGINKLVVKGRGGDDSIKVSNPLDDSLHIIGYGGVGNDTLKTIGVGKNEFYGGPNNDKLFGGFGANFINGGRDVDCAKNCTTEDICLSIELSDCPEEEEEEPATEEP